MSLCPYENYLGINSLGRIGKSTLWYHLQEDHFDKFVIIVGRHIESIKKEGERSKRRNNQ